MADNKKDSMLPGEIRDHIFYPIRHVVAEWKARQDSQQETQKPKPPKPKEKPEENTQNSD